MNEMNEQILNFCLNNYKYIFLPILQQQKQRKKRFLL